MANALDIVRSSFLWRIFLEKIFRRAQCQRSAHSRIHRGHACVSSECIAARAHIFVCVAETEILV